MTRDVRRALWVASFDMESLISLILQGGVLLSTGLVAASFAVSWMLRLPPAPSENLHARSLTALVILQGLPLAESPASWPRLLLILGVAVLMLTPYTRVLVTTLYFAAVHRSWKHLAFTGIVLILATLAVLTDWL